MTLKTVGRWALAACCALSLAACSKPHTHDDKNLAEGRAFLAQNAKADGVHVTPSGLQYKILRSGPSDGPQPTMTSQVRVEYEGKLLNGTVFDSTYQRGEPAMLEMGGLVPAWTEALQKMRPGDQWMIYAPPMLAYGDDAAGPIPADSTLIFKIELLSVTPD